MSTYLVTGGAGFIGSHLCERLLTGGHQVVSIDNLDPFYDKAIKLGNLESVKAAATAAGQHFEDYRGDIRDIHFVDSVFKKHKIDATVHLAALAGVRPSIERPVDYWSVNATGTATLLQAHKTHGVKKFVYASSSSVYGNCKTAPFKEDMFLENPISPYAATKRAGELMCYNSSHLEGVNTICIRFFTVYGPRQRPDLAIHKFCRLILEGKPIPFFGDGNSERDYTFVSDICDGVISAIDYAQSCPYDIINLGESNTISLKGLVSTIEAALGKKAVLNKLPFQPGDMPRTWADVTHARETLGYEPKVGKEEGIKRFAEWLLKQPGVV